MAGERRRKLPKAERRGQLLEMAHAIVREDGTDALTLARVAERAGVSKPIAYEHFGTRAGLLMALFKDIDDHHLHTLNEALARAPARLEEVARVAAATCMACYAECGPDALAIASALSGDDEMDAFHQGLMDAYVNLYCEVLAPYCGLPAEALHMYCAGFVGAAEGLSRELLRGRIGQADAAAILASTIVATLSADRDPRPPAD